MKPLGTIIAILLYIMRTRFNTICIVWLFIAIFLGVSGGVDASLAAEAVPADVGAVTVPDPATLMDANADALFTLINAARRNPLETAVSLGMDRQQVLDSLPELKDILVNGLPPLAFNERLYQAAGDHAREMLANSYYAYESMDGRTADQRLRDAGYAPVKSGESIGLVFFKNFIGSDRAVSQIFAKMFKDELSPEWTGPRNILNPDFKDIGVGVCGGLYQFDGTKGNVYLSACDFGYSIEPYELQVLQLINQFRARPADVAVFLNIHVDDITGVFPELKPVFLAGLPPVRFNSDLYLSADAKINDMVENNYFGYASPGGVTLGERIWTAGYRAEWAAESLARMFSFDNSIPPGLMVSQIFRQLFSNSLRTEGYRDANLLSEKAVDAGFRIKAVESSVLSGISGDHAYVAAGDFGDPLIKMDPVISGVVFADENGNDLYDAGEEVPNTAVTIRAQGASGASRTVMTNPAGGYAVSVTPGLYCVSVGEGEGFHFKWVQAETANVWQAFQLSK